ncbi:replicative DNA helicase [Paludisphaera mucosa]|uniref:Replicative DNA helicase n=1 Tax=Paludisphaera mucosa TaxID=3030827 RepID=A0ABT6FGM5_9BACT|nr:replicative DNA helicase [Paludisphaera mucosa]MDG3006720.1 replicative DNA helicase [Paludisphaera mucosa]
MASVPGYSNGAGTGRDGSNGNGSYGKSDGGGLSDRLPPQNLDAERSVLGGILLDNDVLHDIVAFLTPDDFYRDAHQLVYRAIREMYDDGKAIDAVTLGDELDRRGQLPQVGGEDGLSELANSVPHAANARYHAEIVRQKSVSRQLIQSATEIIRDGYSNLYTSQQLLETAERKVFAIAEEQIKGQVYELKGVLSEAMDRITKRTEETHVVTGVGTGFYDLDDITTGFQPEQLIILAARPSMGKTALALNICAHAAIQLRTPTLIVSLEMGRLELGERLLSAHAKVDSNKLRTGRGMDYRELNKLGKAFGEMETAPIHIDDTPSRNMLQITASARRLKMRQGLGMIMIDYIQLIDSDESRDSRQEQIAKISRRLKMLARELHVPVVALSQLNRAVENREDRRPRMADLRESGAIEQDADVVLLLHRPDYYDANDQPGIAEVIVAKNRSGRTDTAKLVFLKNLTLFDNKANIEQPIDEGRPF